MRIKASHTVDMKLAIKTLVALQVCCFLMLVWYLWIVQYKTGRHTPRKQKPQFHPVVNKYKSINLTVGKSSAQFTYKIYTNGALNKATVLTNGCKTTLHVEHKIELITGYIDFVRNKRYREFLGQLAL